MSKVAIIVGSILGVLLLMGMWVMGNYNSLVSSRNQVEKSWSMVETTYQRRLDLIGNLVEFAKGAQGQELAVYGKIADARKIYDNPSSTSDQKAAAASTIETNVVALIPRLQEAYPDLKSNQQVQDGMNQLKSTEDGVQKARDAYNNVATNYNTSIERFPKNIFASSFGFTKKSLFKSDAEAAKATKVQF